MPKNGVAPFIDKLDQILQTQEYNHIISWTPEGDAFVIKSVSQLINKHKNYSSFNRQLNLYNFIKIRCQTDEIVFSNEHFLRYDKDQYRFIKRTKGQDKEDDQLQVAEPKTIVGQLKQLGNRQYKLQQVCKNIFHQNQQIIRSNAKLWKKISQKLDIKNKQLSAILYQLLMRIGNKQGLSNLQLMDQNEIHQQNQINSDSSDSQDVIETPKSFTKQLFSFLQNKNLNLQDLLSYFNSQKNKRKDPPIIQTRLVEEPNLYLKQNGESQKALSQREPSVISDMNHFLNFNRSDSIKTFSDYGI